MAMKYVKAASFAFAIIDIHAGEVESESSCLNGYDDDNAI